MAGLRALAVRAVGTAWDLSPAWRRPLRRLRLTASLLRHRLRAARLGAAAPVRVVDELGEWHGEPVGSPAVRLAPTLDLVAQTGTAVALEDHGRPVLWLASGSGLGGLPETHLEALLMAWAATAAPVVAGGWAAPARAPGAGATAIHLDPGAPRGAHVALGVPSADGPRSALAGHVVGHVTAPEALADRALLTLPLTAAAGTARLPADIRPGAVVRRRLRPVDRVLVGLPPVSGQRTVMFMLPYLAVGGAERLLFDLLEGLAGRARLLVVTSEPHTAALGQTVDRCRELTPHVYTLGDWLPRPALAGAVRHLVRRWQVATVMSWNGSTLFYDLLPELAAAPHRPRLVAQLYHHRGGWTAHHGPRTVRALDAHVAVNTDIARTLVADHGVPPAAVATIHHGVPLPVLPDEAERQRRRRRRRAELGLPADAVVVGTFIRLHRQKRPLDVVRLARRLAGSGLHFLLAGGGPLDAEVDAELARRPLANLTRLPLRSDPERLYEALDLCLMTSAYEGLPVFLLDGLARGLPCVATAVGDIPLLLAEGGGVVAGPPGDLDALEDGLRSLLDPATRAREGARGRAAVAARFGLERYVARYEEVLFPS